MSLISFVASTSLINLKFRLIFKKFPLAAHIMLVGLNNIQKSAYEVTKGFCFVSLSCPDLLVLVFDPESFPDVTGCAWGHGLSVMRGGQNHPVLTMLPKFLPAVVKVTEFIDAGLRWTGGPGKRWGLRTTGLASRLPTRR